MISADDALRTLTSIEAALTQWQAADLNESDTRGKILDAILRDVLGWDEASIRREQRTIDGEFLDYIVANGTNSLILEAKRAGIYFDLPQGSTHRARREGVLSKSRGLKPALDQVVSYCRQSGVPLGVAANGLQMVVTLPFAVPGDSYDSIVFDGIEDIRNRFVEFWNLLSPQGSGFEYARQLLRTPTQIRTPPLNPRRIRDFTIHPDDTIERNPVSAAIDPTLRRYFSDIISPGREDLLEKGYVESSRQAQYGKTFDELLAGTLPHLASGTVELEVGRRTAPSFDKAIEDLTADPGGSENVALIVGTVGAGKTTFLHRYFSFLASDDVRRRTIPVFVDFLALQETPETFDASVSELVLDELRKHHQIDDWETLQEIYRTEFTRMQRGILKPIFDSDPARGLERAAEEIAKLVADPEAHVARVIRFIKQRHGVVPCVIFDNTDQLGQDVQHRVLRLAFQKSRSWGVVTLIALRGETYWRFRNSPPIDAYHRQAFHVLSPRFANVLSRRLILAKEAAGDAELSFSVSLGRVSGVRVRDFLQVLVDSFLGRDDTRTRLFLEVLASGDMRFGLDLFTTFLRSGHTNTDEYLRNLIESGTYFVPLHHLLRGVAFGDRQHYDSSQSLIANVFSLEEDGFYSHFSKLRILRYLHSISHTESTAGRGFLSTERLFDVFRPLSSDVNGIRNLLTPLLKHRLVEAANGYRVSGEAADYVRLTAAGLYYSSILSRQFAYLDLVAGDTPIKDPKSFERINEVALSAGIPINTIEQRLEKTERFIEYLVAEEATELPLLRGLPQGSDSPIMPEIQTAMQNQRQDVLSGAIRARRRRS